MALTQPSSRHEPRWPAALAVILATALELTLPPRLSLGPAWVLPALVLILLVPLLIFFPNRQEETPLRRAWSITLIAIVNAFNFASVVLLIFHIIHPILPKPLTGTQLLIAGAQIWLTNVIVFGLWFWEIDAGGPKARANLAPTEARQSDFLFPQMMLVGSNARLADPQWRPLFVDYVYVAFTNALAFSPTDTMPLTRAAKMLMLLEAIVSFISIAVVVSRSINIIS